LKYFHLKSQHFRCENHLHVDTAALVEAGAYAVAFVLAESFGAACTQAVACVRSWYFLSAGLCLVEVAKVE
jgi:hypothetical protein